MKVLFIGGPKDGKRENIPNGLGYSYQCAVRTGSNAAAYQPNSPLAHSVGISTHVYNLKQTQLTNGEVATVAVHSSVPDMMEKLIKGYRYHRKPVDPYTRSQRKMRTKIQAIYNGQPPYPPVWMNP